MLSATDLNRTGDAFARSFFGLFQMRKLERSTQRENEGTASNEKANSIETF
jgi:hypothetical protein